MKWTQLGYERWILVSNQSYLQNLFVGFGFKGNFNMLERAQNINIHSFGELGENCMRILKPEVSDLMPLDIPYMALPVKNTTQLSFRP